MAQVVTDTVVNVEATAGTGSTTVVVNVLEPSDDLTSTRFRKRTARSRLEELHLKGIPERGFWGLFFLHNPPFFHPSTEACGEEIHAGHVSKWTTFLLVETLLAGLSIQPLVTDVTGQTGKDWQHKLYGCLWMLTLLGSFVGLVVNAALLGHLLHCPRTLAWIWLCKLGLVSELPRLFMWLTSVLMFLSIGFSTWSLFGFQVGLVCVLVELVALAFAKYFMMRLKKALQEVYNLQ